MVARDITLLFLLQTFVVGGTRALGESTLGVGNLGHRTTAAVEDGQVPTSAGCTSSIPTFGLDQLHSLIQRVHHFLGASQDDGDQLRDVVEVLDDDHVITT